MTEIFFHTALLPLIAIVEVQCIVKLDSLVDLVHYSLMGEVQGISRALTDFEELLVVHSIESVDEDPLLFPREQFVGTQWWRWYVSISIS